LTPVAYTVADWCDLTKLSKPTAYRMMADGRLRYIQVGATRRIPAEEKVRLGFASSI
jgi:excisionase family DNA binding protein